MPIRDPWELENGHYYEIQLMKPRTLDQRARTPERTFKGKVLRRDPSAMGSVLVLDVERGLAVQVNNTNFGEAKEVPE